MRHISHGIVLPTLAQLRAIEWIGSTGPDGDVGCPACLEDATRHEQPRDVHSRWVGTHRPECWLAVFIEAVARREAASRVTP